MGLAFRLYGDFNWPPSPVEANTKEKRRGHLEVWYLKDTSHWRAALRFIPEEGSVLGAPLVAADVAPIAAGRRASTHFDRLVVAYINNAKAPVPSIWLDDGASNGGLTFRGAFLIEEFGDKGTLVLRLPLANGVVYGNTLSSPAPSSTATFSGLRVFADTPADPRFAFHLHLPLPVRHAQKSSARSFPMALEYLATQTREPSLPLPINKLRGGWVDDTGKGGTGVELRRQRIPAKDFWFGNFGFSEKGKTSSTTPYRNDFVVYERTGVKLEHYWPSNGTCFAEDVAGGYGFVVKPNNWAAESDGTPADLSLRFVRTKKGPVVGLTYRVRINRPLSGNPSANTGSDFDDYLDNPPVDRIITLRLERELAGQLGSEQYFADHTANPPTKPKEFEGWIRTGNRLSADCQLKWDVGTRVWATDRSRQWQPTVTLRLHWPETVSSMTTEQVTAGGGYLRAGLLRAAAHSFKEVRDALPEGEAGNPVSFLPDLELSGGRQRVRFSLYGTPIIATIGPNSLVSWGQEIVAGVPTANWMRPATRLSLAHCDDLIANTDDFKEPRELTIKASGISFFRSSSNPTFVLTLRHDEEWPPTAAGAADTGYFASFALRSETTEHWSGRLASLDFAAQAQLATVKDADRHDGYLRVGGTGSDTYQGRGGPRLLYPQGRAAAEIRFSLQASQVTPITVDVQRSDRSGRPAPLLIDLNSSSDAIAQAPGTKVKYWLLATESILPREDRKLRAEIFDAATDEARRSYAVLSMQPFSVFRYSAEPISARGTQESTSVAIYDGDTRTWQYKLVSRHYRYSLPPQSIGESADKPGRLEIHDDLVDPPVGIAPIVPFVRHLKPDGTLDEVASSRDRRAVEYRLTPSAEMWIMPSDLARGYFMPEASSHDIFRQYGAYGLGAALAYLRAEFLYGLSVGIDVSKESSVARGARVAEIEAIVGRLPGPARETDAEPTVKDRWNALRETVARRPERLEVWARDPDSDVDFTPARFTEGTTFALRGTALHRAPIIDGTATRLPEGEEALADWPTVGHNVWPPEEVTGTPPALDLSVPRHHPQGLSGGALWPVESLNLLNALLTQPQSVGGTIERIALSPIGGDASQKAEFLNGQLAIISETYNGRVQRLQLEVIGRIEALWHRAKHVVVYERTVNPTAQFAPKNDSEGTRSRRPILRKVREYIELLQPERAYPDFSTATARHAGFLNRVRFNSRIINVDSAWSNEVGDYGWQIPLWNRLSARERPQVYPMPDVAFVTAAEGDGDSPVVAQDCSDPDQLFFFADFKAATSDTDRWEARLGLDFANMPAAQVIAENFDAAGAAGAYEPGAPEPRRRAVGRILPGLRRFTWRLAPAAQKTAINAGRTGKPIYVGVESVSFMRATHQESVQKQLNATLQKAIGATVDPKVDGARYWTGDGKGAHPKLAATAQTLSDSITYIASLKPGSPKYQEKVLAAVQAVVATKSVGVSEIAAMAPAKGLFDKVANLASGLPDQALCEKLKADATSTIKRKELLVRTALADLVTELDGRLKDLEFTSITTKTALITHVTNEAIAEVTPLFEGASQDVTKVGLAVEKARAIVLDAGDELDAVFARAEARLKQFRAGYDETKPWSAPRIDGFRKGAEAAVAGVVDDISTAIAEASERLAVELGDVGQQIAGHIAKALQALAVERNQIVGDVLTFKSIAAGLLANLEADLLDANALATGKLSQLKQAVESDTNIAGPANEALRKSLVDALDTVASAVAITTEEAKTLGSSLDSGVKNVAANFVGAVDAFIQGMSKIGADLITATHAFVGFTNELNNLGAQALLAQLISLEGVVNIHLTSAATAAQAKLAQIGTPVDAIVVPAIAQLHLALDRLHQELAPIPEQISRIADDINSALAEVQQMLSPSGLVEEAIRPTIEQTLETVLKAVPETLNWTNHLATVRRQLQLLPAEVADRLRTYSKPLYEGVTSITEACSAVAEGIGQVEQYLDTLASSGAQYLRTKAEGLYNALDAIAQPATDALQLIAALNDFDKGVRRLHNDVSRAFQTADAYGDRVFDAVSNLSHGGLSAAPSNLLKLYSAVTSAPELAALKADIERIRSTFDELGDIIAVTKTNAMFDRLGDELKALGLSIPFDKIGDRLLPADLSKLDIGSVFRNFGGAKLDRLFKGYKIPAGVRDAIKITHDFDKKQARAWVQVDIAAPFPGRRSLFSLGVFKADFVDMHLTGRVRLEVSQEQEKVAVTGFGHIATTLDAVVGGQSMVRFEKFGLEFTKEKGLDVQFDPKNAKLNPQFKWIQDFLSGLFPDLGGGLEWIRENGIPVGVQHDFVLPPLSLTFGTSGVSNIGIENHFKLVAFPDFMIANRFNLSSIDRPFIFSIFIIGGTGYIQIDAEYKPIRNELAVLVEAGAGGSAQLAFAFGPFIGQIFITISGVLSYRKVLGKSGGGLAISMVLVITGQVDVCGIVTVCITLMLRMSYRDNGQIDADGSLTVTIRISRFFKLRARAQVKYKLRGGKSETTTSLGASAMATSAKSSPRARPQSPYVTLKNDAKRLEGALK